MLDLTDWQNKKYVAGLKEAEVRILCIDADGDQPIVGIYNGSIERWSIDGIYNPHLPHGDMNLVNSKTKCEGWVVLTKDGCYPALGFNIYSTKKELLNRFPHAIPAHIEWEE